MPKEKNYRKTTIHCPHYGFSISVYRVFKLALLCNHANASFHLHNCSGILGRNEVRYMPIKQSGNRELLLTLWGWLQVCIGNLLKNKRLRGGVMQLFQALGWWLIPAEKLNQNMINQSRKSPTGRERDWEAEMWAYCLCRKREWKKYKWSLWSQVNSFYVFG